MIVDVLAFVAHVLAVWGTLELTIRGYALIGFPFASAIRTIATADRVVVEREDQDP